MIVADFWIDVAPWICVGFFAYSVAVVVFFTALVIVREINEARERSDELSRSTLAAVERVAESTAPPSPGGTFGFAYDSSLEGALVWVANGDREGEPRR